jgi:hypothetical protein
VEIANRKNEIRGAFCETPLITSDTTLGESFLYSSNIVDAFQWREIRDVFEKVQE